MAYLRESDLIRIRKAGLISQTSMNNPFCIEVLDSLDNSPGTAWLGLSWRQYLYWFADFEHRFNIDLINSRQFLKNSDENWKYLDENDIFMEERANDGAWIRLWRRAINEFCD